MKKIVVIIFLSFLTYIECGKIRRFPFLKNTRSCYMRDVISEWAAENNIYITYKKTVTKSRTIRKRVFEKDGKCYSCLTHLAHDYPNLSIRCMYCLSRETLVRGEDYQLHHHLFHSKNRKKREEDILREALVKAEESKSMYVMDDAEEPEYSASALVPFRALCCVASIIRQPGTLTKK